LCSLYHWKIKNIGLFFSSFVLFDCVCVVDVEMASKTDRDTLIRGLEFIIDKNKEKQL